MRRLTLVLAATLPGLMGPVLAQHPDHGRQLAERWCAECHAIGAEPARFRRARPFVAIAARESLTGETLVKFLLLPHATMANHPLSRADADDLASYILTFRK